MSERLLEGKVALVTGAGRGLGRAFAERLALLGCGIAVHGMRETGPSEYGGTQTLSDVARAIAETYQVRTIKLLGDLTRPDDIDRVVGEATATLGPIDILVHNAGGDIAAVGGKPNPNDVVHIKTEDVRAVLDRNLLSTIFVCQRVAHVAADCRICDFAINYKGGFQGFPVNPGLIHELYGFLTCPDVHWGRLHRDQNDVACDDR